MISTDVLVCVRMACELSLDLLQVVCQDLLSTVNLATCNKSVAFLAVKLRNDWIRVKVRVRNWISVLCG